MGSLFSKTKDRHNIATTMGEVNKTLKEIADCRQRYKLDDCVISPATSSSSIDPRIALVHGAKASMLVWIDEPKDAVIKMLSHDNMSEKDTVVSIVGFGGLGKTTLAKAAYEQLKHKYDCGAFVSVGRSPEIEKVLKDLFYDLDKHQFKEIHSSQRGAESLIQELLEFLRNKRYLIVIDDVWEAQSRNRIKEALTENNNGSRTIITTRNSEVATGEVYRLQPLSDDNSKKLYYIRIFCEDKCPDNQPEDVSEAANKILKKCGGVPLAIITMASLLVGKSKEQWFELCNSIVSRDKDKYQLADDTTWILSLSYYDLPPHLKTCLMYLSVFPEDHMIKKNPLIWMWIGEGFVNGESGNGLFEIGERYFNDLINRSLVQPVENQINKIIEGCRVHDMILDLIRSLSQETKFAVVLDNSCEGTLCGNNARRLALQSKEMEYDSPQDNHTDEARARSFIAFGCRFGSWPLLGNFKLLRVLHLESCRHNIHFPIGDLLHLRYLGIHNFRASGTLKLPKEIGALKFLQVLDFDGSHISELPLSVGMLTQLVCLRVFLDYGFKVAGGIIKNLTSLQELQIDVRNNDKGQFVKDLGNLSELRVLRTSIDWTDKAIQSDLLKSLGNLDKLKHLELSCTGSSPDNETWDEALLPRGLRLLILVGVFYYSSLPSCIDPLCLRKLSHLRLCVHYLGDQGLEILGGLLELSFLYLCVRHGRATLTGTATHGYFRKLRSCMLLSSMVQFVVNEDSNVQFTIWSDDAPSFGYKQRQDSYRVERSIMPILEYLYFQEDVCELKRCDNGSCDNLGLEYLASLQKVSVDLECYGAQVDVVEKEEAALSLAIQNHPNRPTLVIDTDNKGDSWQSDDEELGEEEDLDEEEDEVLSTDDEDAWDSIK